MKPILYAAWSFRGATEGGEPGIYSPRPGGYGFRARRIRSRVYPRSALDNAHIGNSRCAAAPRNDAAHDSNFEIALLAVAARVGCWGSAAHYVATL